MVFWGKIYNPDSLVSITQLTSVKSVETQLLNGDKINCLVQCAASKLTFDAPDHGLVKNLPANGIRIHKPE